MVHTLAVVIPVYQGEHSLGAVVDELVTCTAATTTPAGHSFRLIEVILVHDGAIDRSDQVIESLAWRHPLVTPVWLSRNYGQHPATLAGLARTTADWVVTMDEDGQHEPHQIGLLLDHALAERRQVVYAHPANRPPQGLFRNWSSWFVKLLFTSVLGHHDFGRFSSFRLIEGQIARCLGAYCGPNVYLDAALSWLVGSSGCCPTPLRAGCSRPSGYSYAKLVKHFWRLLLTSGTRPLRMISLLGLASIFFSLGYSCYVLCLKWTNQIEAVGWTSLAILICFFSGCILLALGVIAEYLGLTLQMAMGKPLYLEVNKPVVRERDRKQVAA